MLGYGRFGCVISPPLNCSGKRSTGVGKLFSSTNTQRTWGKEFRELYPLLENPEFEEYQRKFPTEWEKAEEIRRRIPSADDLFVLPTESCGISDPMSENVVACLTKVSANLNTQLILSQAEGNLRELIASGKEMKKHMLEALETLKQSIHILHTHRIIHNDISMENILWGYSGSGELWCKLGDFGISMMFPTLDDKDSTARIEESARSSSSSNSFGSISPVPRAPTPSMPPLIKPLALTTKKGLVPSLALGSLVRSPRPESSRITVENEFARMKEMDLAALDGVLRIVGV